MFRPLSMLRLLFALGAFGFAAAAAPVAAQKAESAPKPDTYLCPHSSGGALDCYLDAIDHLYTMCRQVKSIEIIEFGYEKSDEGVNGAKSAYCVDKHKQSMARPLQSALREAAKNRAAIDALRELHDVWLLALVELKWNPGENDAEYKARVAKPYAVFRERGTLVRAALPAATAKTATAAAALPAAKPKAAKAAAAPAPRKSPN
jgi:hypothetical protein